MANQVNWQDFDKLHVIRRLRQLVGKWWKVQLNFTDEKGFVRGVPEGKFFNPINPICKVITGDDKGFKGCMSTVKQTTIDATGSKNKRARLSRCHSGFSTLSVPIRVDGKYLGCVFGDGFLVSETEQEQKILIKNYLRTQFSKQEDLLAHIESLPVLSEKDVEYLTELVEIVVDEILMTQANLSNVEKQVSELKSELGARYGFDKMIGKSSPMQSLYSLLERVCDSSALVLIQGENGTGKELIARALHYNSKRKKGKFLAVNCGAFNENLLESELFGHVKGSFTGAVKDKVGLFEATNKGTLFLDEIGDTSMPMQVKLLRVLQEGTYTPVGATVTKKSDARVVCATNKDLTKMVKEGSFREDLFYRLNVINVIVPPLRERKEDITLLLEHFTKRYARSTNLPEKKPNKECMEKILNYNWPGNVRELENEIERLCVLSGEDQHLDEAFLSQRIKEGTEQKYPGYRMEGKLKDALEALEKRMILEGLKRTRWNKSRLAKELGISRAGLIMKVDKYGLDKRNLG
ncbi:MAG: sigma 54-interacting transcriptional regulator [Oligoflexales bacterium]